MAGRKPMDFTKYSEYDDNFRRKEGFRNIYGGEYPVPEVKAPPKIPDALRKFENDLLHPKIIRFNKPVKFNKGEPEYLLMEPQNNNMPECFLLGIICFFVIVLIVRIFRKNEK